MTNAMFETDAPIEDRTGTSPVFKTNECGVHLSVFQNSTVRDDGELATYCSTSIHTRYQDRNGHWQSGDRYSEHQLAVLEDLAREARQFIRHHRAAEKKDALDIESNSD